MAKKYCVWVSIECEEDGDDPYEVEEPEKLITTRRVVVSKIEYLFDTKQDAVNFIATLLPTTTRRKRKQS